MDNSACFFLAQNSRSAWDHRLRMAQIFATSQIEQSYRVDPAWTTGWPTLSLDLQKRNTGISLRNSQMGWVQGLSNVIFYLITLIINIAELFSSLAGQMSSIQQNVWAPNTIQVLSSE